MVYYDVLTYINCHEIRPHELYNIWAMTSKIRTRQNNVDIGQYNIFFYFIMIFSKI